MLPKRSQQSENHLFSKKWLNARKNSKVWGILASPLPCPSPYFGSTLANKHLCNILAMKTSSLAITGQDTMGLELSNSPTLGNDDNLSDLADNRQSVISGLVLFHLNQNRLSLSSYWQSSDLAAAWGGSTSWGPKEAIQKAWKENLENRYPFGWKALRYSWQSRRSYACSAT